MKPPLIKLPPKLYVIALGIVAVCFAGTLGGVIALAMTGKPVPPELMKQFLGLGATLGFGFSSIREEGDAPSDADKGSIE
jgi:hypothetical protein